MSILDLLEKVENGVDIDHFTIHWSMKNMGWGQYHFYMGKDDKVHIQNECMTKEAIKQVLCMMVDEAILDDEVSAQATLTDTIVNDEGC